MILQSVRFFVVGCGFRGDGAEGAREKGVVMLGMQKGLVNLGIKRGSRSLGRGFSIERKRGWCFPR